MQPESASVDGSSYDPSYYASLRAVEDRHFWFSARNRVVEILASQVVRGWSPGYRVLEVGCGTGNVLAALTRACPDGLVTGVDLFHEGLVYASQRISCPLVRADLQALPFGPTADMIGLFDVLEHLDEDVAMLQKLRAALRPQGALLLTVPAHPSLWSYFDEASRHRRRYGRRQLQEKLETSGYQVEYLSYTMSAILPLIWARRRAAAVLQRGTSHSQERTRKLTLGDLQVNPVLNRILALSLVPELWLIRRRASLPFGASLVAVARRR